MLQTNKAPPSANGDSVGLRGASLSDVLQSFTGFVRRQFRVFLILVPCTTILGLLYLFTTPPNFTATGTVVIDTRKMQLLQQQSVMGEIALDPGTAQTEVEVLKSPNVSLSVIKNLRLTEDPEFVAGGGLFGIVLKFIPILNVLESGVKQSETQRALDAFERRLTVSRVGQTYVMEISFRSSDPAKSARIVNAIADAYIMEQLEAKYEAARRATSWLQDRINDLRTKVSVADRDVEDFKRANKIITVEAANKGGNARLINEQQVSEVNTQLSLARAATAEAKARLDRIQDVLKQEVPDASVADALKSEVIIRMRNQYLDLAGRERIWEARYGADHQATRDLRTQMLGVRANINDEMKKIAGSYKSDYEVAFAREQSLINSLASVVKESQITNQAQIQLRDLESKAQSYRTTYDNFLQRYTEAVQQQSFPITEARVIGPATPPTHPSQPIPLLILAISTASGLMLSFAVALYREHSDRGFRTNIQIEEVLGANCIATLPTVKLAKPPAHYGTAKDITPTAPRTLVHPHNLLRYVIDTPFSQFTEALRSVKVAMDLNSVLTSNKVIGVTSTVPNEGKSTIASNFAHLIAHAGRRGILIDADLHQPSLSRAFAPNAFVGLIDVIAGKVELADAIWTEPSTGLNFLPAGSTSKLLHTDEILASDSLKKLFDRLRESFDNVIVDLPPLAPVVDTRATTNFIDFYVYVAEWGRTTRDMAQHALGEAPEIYDRLLGVILNKVDMNVMSRYQSYASHYHNREDYS
jgi:polysaccharide biosynthesis transport protein